MPEESAGAFRHHPDPFVARVGDHQIPCGTDRYSRRVSEPGLGSRAAILVVPERTSSGDRVNIPGLHRLPVKSARAGRHHPDPLVVGVGDHLVACAVYRHPLRPVELGRGGRAAVPRVVRRTTAVSRNGVNVSCFHRLPVVGAVACCHHPDPAIPKVGDQQVARAAHCYSQRKVDRGAGSGAAVPGKATSAVPRDGVDVPGGHRPPVEGARGSCHHPDPAVVAVGDDDVARCVDGHWPREGEFRGGSRAAVAGEPKAAVPGDGVDVPGGHRLPVEGARAGCHDADPVVAGIDDQQVARGVRRHALRVVEFGCGGRATIPGKPQCAVPGDGVDVPGGHRQPVERPGAGRHHPDTLVQHVGDQHIARPIHSDPVRLVKFGGGR